MSKSTALPATVSLGTPQQTVKPNAPGQENVALPAVVSMGDQTVTPGMAGE